MRLFCIIYLAAIVAQCGHDVEYRNRRTAAARKATDTATQRARIDPRPSKDIDGEFFDYMDGFPEPFDHLAMWFEDRKGKTLGTCITWPSGHQGIAIDPERWEDLSWIRRRALIWHELAHCTSIDLRHNNTYWSYSKDTGESYRCHEVDKAPAEYRCYGTPDSIMNWQMPSELELELMMLGFNPNLDEFTKLFFETLD